MLFGDEGMSARGIIKIENSRRDVIQSGTCAVSANNCVFNEGRMEEKEEGTSHLHREYIIN